MCAERGKKAGAQAVVVVVVVVVAVAVVGLPEGRTEGNLPIARQFALASYAFYF